MRIPCIWTWFLYGVATNNNQTSRRTNIPAFYAEWMLHRLRAGYCTVANPSNRNQVNRISLRREDVDVIVFWTRNPRPLMQYIPELDSQRYRYYFQFTILGVTLGKSTTKPRLPRLLSRHFVSFQSDLAQPG